jgi:hypothetical protein
LRRDADLESVLPDVSEGQRGLDVVLLHRLILDKGLGISAEAVAAEKNLGYEREIEAAIARVDRGEAQIAFLLKAVRVQQVADIALAGDVLTAKIHGFLSQAVERRGHLPPGRQPLGRFQYEAKKRTPASFVLGSRA